MKSSSLFIGQSIKNIIKIGSIVPSSYWLAKRVARHIEAKVVVELGPGTGVFTKEILKRLPADGKLICVENNIPFIDHLQGAVVDSRLQVLVGDALDLGNLLKNIGINKVDCIVSGLPIANFTKSDRGKVLQEIHDCLKKDGKFIQFEYFLAAIKSIKRFFPRMHISYEIFNIPPAFVMECTKVADE